MQKVQDFLNPYADKASYLKWWSFFLFAALMGGNCFFIAFGPATLSLWTGEHTLLLGIVVSLVYSAALMFFISALVYQGFHYPTTLQNNWLVFPHSQYSSYVMGPFDHKLAKLYAKTYSKPTWEGYRDATIVKANSRMEAKKKAKEVIK